jgi:hypothetical protein
MAITKERNAASHDWQARHQKWSLTPDVLPGLDSEETERYHRLKREIAGRRSELDALQKKITDATVERRGRQGRGT